MRILGQGTASGEDEQWLMTSLRELDFFTPLSDEQLRKILYFAKTVEFDAEETVFRQGDDGDSFFLILSGRLQARQSGFLGMRRVLREMGPGDFFGELALILRQPRSADVHCVEPAVCLALDRADFETLLERTPDIAQAVKKIAKERFDDSP